jgi:hypothetical protein
LLGFLATFSKQNVADDEELRLLVEESRSLLQGRDVEELRKNRGLREPRPGA